MIASLIMSWEQSQQMHATNSQQRPKSCDSVTTGAKRELTLYDACVGGDDEAFAFGAAAGAFLGGIMYDWYGMIVELMSFRTSY